MDSFDGEILIDSVNIKRISLVYLRYLIHINLTILRNNFLLNSFRAKMGIVSQDPLIFSGTFRENIDPKGDFNDDSIMRAVQKCQLSGLVLQFGGLGGEVGESGNLLSAGQKQLVQLARAMLVNPKVTPLIDNRSW